MDDKQIFIKPQDVENLNKYLPGVYESFDELTAKIGDIVVHIVREREKLEEEISRSR